MESQTTRMTLARALKLKNRLVESLRKTEENIKEFNCIAASAIVVVDINEELAKRNKLSKQIISLKDQIAQANIPILPKLIELPELKASIAFLKAIPTNNGKMYSNSRWSSATELLDYQSQLQKKDIDVMITDCESKIDDMQESLDNYNSLTNITVVL